MNVSEIIYNTFGIPNHVNLSMFFISNYLLLETGEICSYAINVKKNIKDRKRN